MQPTQAFDRDGQQVGTYLRSIDTPDGEMLLIAREERLGGGSVVTPTPYCSGRELPGSGSSAPYPEGGKTMSQETRVSHPRYSLRAAEVEGFDSLAELALDMITRALRSLWKTRRFCGSDDLIGER